MSWKLLPVKHSAGDWEFADPPGVCSFGITEAIASFIVPALTDLGVGAETAAAFGNIGAGVIEGGAVGALTDPKNPLKGAEFGAISGGVGAGVSPFVSELGLGAVGTDAISGALGGAVGGLATGRNPLTSAALGGVAGGIEGAINTTSGGAATSGGPATNAAATAAPTSLGTPPSAATDVTLTPGFSTPDVSASLASSGYPGATQSVASAAPAAAAAAPGASTGVTGWLKDNPWAVPAAGMAINAIRGDQALPGQKQLTADAASLRTNATQLESYYRSGTLPPGLQVGLNEAAAAAKASIRSTYAAAGDAGSSAEMQDIAAVEERKQAQGAQIALQLLQTGMNEQNAADELYLKLMGVALQQDQALGQAFANFASGLVPSVPGAERTYTLTPAGTA